MVPKGPTLRESPIRSTIDEFADGVERADLLDAVAAGGGVAGMGVARAGAVDEEPGFFWVGTGFGVGVDGRGRLGFFGVVEGFAAGAGVV